MCGIFLQFETRLVFMQISMECPQCTRTYRNVVRMSSNPTWKEGLIAKVHTHSRRSCVGVCAMLVCECSLHVICSQQCLCHMTFIATVM